MLDFFIFSRYISGSSPKAVGSVWDWVYPFFDADDNDSYD